MSENLLAISSSPHFRSRTVTRTIMREVLLALCPTLVASVVIFGFRALLLCVVCVASCMGMEYLYRRFMGLNNTVGDLSAAVTGLLLAFNLPANLPPWMAVIGCFVAVIVVKQLFGGIGKNFANPAIVGRIVLLLSFTTAMTTWPQTIWLRTADALTGATPLALADGITSATVALPKPTYWQLLIGNTGGSLGETCAITLLLGGIYLIVRKFIMPTIPVAFLGTVFLLSLACGADPVYQLLSGGVILGAFFMATDYVTSPTTEPGKVVFGIGCGVITVVIRQFGSYPEGVSFAILLMNIMTPLIDRATRIRPLGVSRKGIGR